MLEIKFKNENMCLKNVNYLKENMLSFILFEFFFGVNRLYLLCSRRYVLWLSYIYSLFIIVFAATYSFEARVKSTSGTIYKNILGVEFLIIGLNALFFQKKNLNKLFLNYEKFDEVLNIVNEISRLIPKLWYLFGIGAIFLLNVIDNLLKFPYVSYIYDSYYNWYIAYIIVLVHDAEIGFFCFFLATILSRLCILEAHVAKVFNANDDVKYPNVIKTLTKRANLTVTCLHTAYDLLNKCSEQLNNVLNLPVTIILLASGLSTILHFKYGIVKFQRGSDLTDPMVIYTISRCLKNLLLLTFFCYFCNKTKSRVSVLRTIIHDVLNYTQLDKTERRKIKALYMLTHEKELAYSLWGIVKLDMSLPVSYLKLCIAYIIIILQFSKFFD